MVSIAVAPAPTRLARETRVKSTPGRARSRSASASQVLKDDTVLPLDGVNPIKTLLAMLCGRGDDTAFHARLVAATHRLGPLAHVAAAVFFLAGFSLAFVVDVPTRTAMSYVTAVIGSFLWVYMAATLSWDVLLLVLRTFEFWFLFAVNAMSVLLWGVLYHDQRAIAFVVTGANFVISLCTDANIYTRHLTMRLTAFASPALFTVLTVTVLGLAPDLHYPQYRVLGLTLDAVDLLVNGNVIITFFTALRAYRSQHLVFSRTPIREVECEMYFPSCRLVPQGESRYASVLCSADRLAATTTGASATVNPLELVQYPFARGIDTAHTLSPRLVGAIERHFPIRLLTPVALVGIASTTLGFVSQTIEMHASGEERERITTPPSFPFAAPLAWLGVSCALCFLVVCSAHAQPVLARRICQEIDAWFVLLQASLVAVGASDALQWAPRPTILIWTVWLWALWLLLLDAVPVGTRRRLALHRGVVLAVVGLVAAPMALAHWLYFAPHRHALVRDRELLRVRVGRVRFEVKLLGFVASKLLTLWIWMGRFLWHELFRSRDAFKLVKRRVYFRVC